MQKIPTIFERDPETNLRTVTKSVTRGCEWVFAGEGKATAKIDGTCVLLRETEIADLRMLKRREVKNGKPDPADFELIEEDQNTGKRVGWVPVSQTDPTDKWHRDALLRAPLNTKAGTYELVGPKVQKNRHDYDEHHLIPHGEIKLPAIDAPPNWNAVMTYCTSGALGHYEGIVWHHRDGRMAKIKARDFDAPE